MASFLILAVSLMVDLSIRVFPQLGVYTPDVLLLGVIYLALRRPMGEAYLAAFLAGIAFDAVLWDHIGLHSLLYVLAAAGVLKLRTWLWAQYAISRWLIAYIIVMGVRFGEVIMWLSYLGYEVPLSFERYVLWGPVVSGLLFAMVPWRQSPIRLGKRIPQVLFSEK
ncbi:MAG: rod shape-determining protein MreD [bacterium]|nr:rod shape-determining protein MreD [bacterium]